MISSLEGFVAGQPHRLQCCVQACAAAGRRCARASKQLGTKEYKRVPGVAKWFTTHVHAWFYNIRALT